MCKLGHSLSYSSHGIGLAMEQYKLLVVALVRNDLAAMDAATMAFPGMAFALGHDKSVTPWTGCKGPPGKLISDSDMSKTGSFPWSQK